jgi:hypothetical protein
VHRRPPSLWLATSAFALTVATALVACEGARPLSPFATGGAGGAGGGEGGGGEEPGLGGPCIEDAQCDDGVDCSFDRCDLELGRCRFTPDASLCDDGVYCNGAEVCELGKGCLPGPPTSCSDDNPCTIDACVESTRSCTRTPRDVDGDGDPDIHCGGGDCNDLDPSVSSLLDEICDNGVDDDCDGDVDMPPCIAPEHDTCGDPKLVEASSSFTISTAGAANDYATSCSPASTTRRDVVLAVVPPPGDPIDVVVRARASNTEVALAMATQCSDPSSEFACSPSYVRASGGFVSRLRARGVGGGASPAAIPVYVTTSGPAEVLVDVSFEPASTAPPNETCGSAAPLVDGAPLAIELVDAEIDLSTSCQAATGELVYAFSLSEARDVNLYASSLDGDGLPSISLRTEACALAEDEVACNRASTAQVFRRALPAGEHRVSVAASAPTDLSVLLVTSPASDPPDDESCSSSATLAHGVTRDVVFDAHQDDHDLGCIGPSRDAAYLLELTEKSDVLLVQRLSASDAGSIALATEPCTAGELIACTLGSQSPVRLRRRGLLAGDRRVVAESLLGLPQQLTAFVRPSTPTSFVLFADDCGNTQLIPPAGGFFQGNTSSATADFSAGCDQSGGPVSGAPDQLLRLELAETRRVVLDSTGSSYPVLLDVRKGPSCPGTEVPLGCTITTSTRPAFLDLTLAPGVYFVQVDGVAGATGAWTLDVHVALP